MSYSFSFTAPTKFDAKERFAAEFDRVVGGQPAHATERKAAIAHADAMIDLLPDPLTTQAVSVSANGSVAWVSQPATGFEFGDHSTVMSVSCSVSASVCAALNAAGD